jgi:hypothetical protein
MTTKTKNPLPAEHKAKNTPTPAQTTLAEQKGAKTEKNPVRGVVKWYDTDNDRAFGFNGEVNVINADKPNVIDTPSTPRAVSVQTANLITSINANFKETRLNQETTTKLAADTRALIATLIGD